MTCERCQGNGEIVTDWEAYLGDAEGDGVEVCPDCGGRDDDDYPEPFGNEARGSPP